MGSCVRYHTALHSTDPQGEEEEKGEAPELLFALPLIESGLGSRARKLQALARRVWMTPGDLPRREGLRG